MFVKKNSKTFHKKNVLKKQYSCKNKTRRHHKGGGFGDKNENLSFKNKILNKTSNLAKGIALNTINDIGNVAGVDINNPDKTQEQIKNVKQILSDPENIKNITQIAKDIGEISIEVGKELAPLAHPLIEKVIDETTIATDKVISSGSTIMGNIIKELPVIGFAAALEQDIEKIGEADAAVTGAISEITTTSANTIKDAHKKVNQVLQEKKNIIDRTQQSINKFSNPSQIPNTNKINTINKINLNNSFTKKNGGYINKHKHRKNTLQRKNIQHKQSSILKNKTQKYNSNKQVRFKL
jgi:hypothetical protein